MSTLPTAAPGAPEPLSMGAVLRIPVMRRLWYAQILGLTLSGLIANRIGVRHVFALCAGLIVVLIVMGKLFMEPKAKAEPAAAAA